MFGAVMSIYGSRMVYVGPTPINSRVCVFMVIKEHVTGATMCFTDVILIVSWTTMQQQ